MLDKILSFLKEKAKHPRITYSDGAYYIANGDKNPCIFTVMTKDTTQSMHYGLLPSNAYDLESFAPTGYFTFYVDFEKNTVTNSIFDDPWRHPGSTIYLNGTQGIGTTREQVREKLIEVLISANILKPY